MRQISLRFVPTAILSRQLAVIRETADNAALIMNLPGQPKSIRETLEGLKDDSGQQIIAGIGLDDFDASQRGQLREELR